MPFQVGMRVPFPSRMLEASWLLRLLVCQSREVKSGMGGMAGLTRVPRPSGPWHGIQSVLKMPPALRSFSACAAVFGVAPEGALGSAATLVIAGGVAAGAAVA